MKKVEFIREELMEDEMVEAAGRIPKFVKDAGRIVKKNYGSADGGFEPYFYFVTDPIIEVDEGYKTYFYIGFMWGSEDNSKDFSDFKESKRYFNDIKKFMGKYRELDSKVYAKSKFNAGGSSEENSVVALFKYPLISDSKQELKKQRKKTIKYLSTKGGVAIDR